jgi:hypothetical protein
MIKVRKDSASALFPRPKSSLYFLPKRVVGTVVTAGDVNSRSSMPSVILIPTISVIQNHF